MEGVWGMNWCGREIGAKLLGKPKSCPRAAPAIELPNANNIKSKRKRTLSPEPNTASNAEWKKPRSVTDASQRLPLDVSLLPANPEQADFASLAYATPGATPTTLTHRPEYPDIKMDMDVDHPDTSPIRQPTALSPSDAPEDEKSWAERVDEAMEDVPSHQVCKDRKAQLRQVISNTYDLQILLKHNEARLIDLELAKCQVALEQMRRCTGPTLVPPDGYTRPSHAAPFGVTDGPYSQHYRQWLLPDAHFDPQPIYAPSAAEVAAQAANRSTRNSGTARKASGKSIGTHHHSDQSVCAPAHPTPVAKKEKSGPLILRRIADGKLVKLVCNDCQRGDMNSIQGFLNHCRIAHKVEYKSHEAAAVDCGRLLDEQEIATLPAEPQTTPAPRPTTRHTPARAPTVTHQVPANTFASVHPYNTPNASIPKSVKPQTQISVAATPSQAQATPVPKPGASSFKPSTATPRLSAMFAKKNVGGDLDQAVFNAKQKVDIGIDDALLSPEASSPSAPSSSKATTTSSRGVLGVARPPSRKGFRQPTQQRPRPSPLAPAPAERNEVPESPHDSLLGVPSLSPHAADSEPGLISDMEEDDDHGSASEEEGAMLPASRGPVLPVAPRTCADADPDAMDVDVAVDDEIDEQGVIIRRNSLLGAEDRGLRSAGGEDRGTAGKRPVQ